METNWKLDFDVQLQSASALSEITKLLRLLKERGISRDEIREYLNSLRLNSPDEKNEDRVLEALDIVEGFCSSDYQVW
jgi:DNA-binding transcriptional MerR regulator